MTGTEVVTAVRVMISDDALGVKLEDTPALTLVNEAEAYLFNEFPRTRLNRVGQLLTRSNLTALGDNLTIDERHKQAMVYYIAFRVYDVDSDDNRDQQQRQNANEGFASIMGRGI